MSCSSGGAVDGVLAGRDRLPVVRDDRAVAPGQRQRRERLRLADEHLAPARRTRRTARAAGRAPGHRRAPLDSSLLAAAPGRSAARALASSPVEAVVESPAARRSRRRRRARRSSPRARSAGSARRRPRSAERLLEAPQRLAQLELAEHLAQPRAVRLARRPAASRSTSTSTSRTAVASCFEMRASSACSVRFSLRLAPEISSMLREHALERAEVLEQLRGGLVADARDARDVVARCRPSARRSRGSARAGCRSGRSRRRGRRSSCR